MPFCLFTTVPRFVSISTDATPIAIHATPISTHGSEMFLPQINSDLCRTQGGLNLPIATPIPLQGEFGWRIREPTKQYPLKESPPDLWLSEISLGALRLCCI